MKKFSTKTVFDYLVGNDIEDYDIDELENNPEFMAEVVCRDKKSYNLCSNEIKINISFIRRVLDHYKNDIEFALKVYDEFDNILDEDDNIDLVEKDQDIFEVSILLYEITKKNKELNLPFKVATNIFIGSEEVAFEIAKSKVDCEVPGLGFYYESQKYKDNPNILDFIAESIIRKIFSEKIDLEKSLHDRYNSYKEFEENSKYAVLIKYISYYDNDLSEYVSLNHKVLENFEDELELIKKNWQSYDNKQQREELIKKIYKDERFERIIERAKEYDMYNPCTVDIDSALMYLGEVFGVAKEMKKALDDYYADGDAIEEDCRDTYPITLEEQKSVVDSIVEDMTREEVAKEDYLYSLCLDILADYKLQEFDKKIDIKDARHLNELKKIFMEELGIKSKDEKISPKNIDKKIIEYKNKPKKDKKD